MKFILAIALTLGSLSAISSTEKCQQHQVDDLGRIAVSSSTNMNLNKCLEWGQQQVKSNIKNNWGHTTIIIQHPGLLGRQLRLSTET